MKRVVTAVRTEKCDYAIEQLLVPQVHNCYPNFHLHGSCLASFQIYVLTFSERGYDIKNNTKL